MYKLKLVLPYLILKDETVSYNYLSHFSMLSYRYSKILYKRSKCHIVNE